MERVDLIYSEQKIYKFYDKLVRPLDLEQDRALMVFLTSRGKYYKPPLKDYVKNDNFFSKYLIKYNDPVLFLQGIRKLNLDPKAYLVRLKMTKQQYEALPEKKRQEIFKDIDTIMFIETPLKNGGKETFVYVHPPVDTMTIYIDLNPKSTIRGTINAVKQVFKQMEDLSTLSIKLAQEAGNKERTIQEMTLIYKWFKRFKTIWLSEVHRTNADTPYYMIDVDTKDAEILSWIESTLGDNDYVARVHTKHGYHLIYRNSKKLREKIYRELLVNAQSVVSKVLGSDVNAKQLIEAKKEVMAPVPGTLQAGFKVRADYFV